MLNSTIVKEESRNNIHGYTEIQWRCVACGHVMNLPQQQNFDYCFHCGKKVIKKIGGEERTNMKFLSASYNKFIQEEHKCRYYDIIYADAKTDGRTIIGFAIAVPDKQKVFFDLEDYVEISDKHIEELTKRILDNEKNMHNLLGNYIDIEID